MAGELADPFKELEDAFNELEWLTWAQAGLAAILVVIYGAISVDKVRQKIQTPKIVREITEQYHNRMTLDELKTAYNKLLPAMKSSSKHVRAEAIGTLSAIEIQLCGYIIQEVDTDLTGLLLQNRSDLESTLTKSKTFNETFAKHSYPSHSPRSYVGNIITENQAQIRYLSAQFSQV